MKNDALPSPGLIPNGPRLRQEMVKAVSYCEVVAGLKAGGKTEQATTLAAFLTATAATLTDLTDSAAPTFVSGVIEAAAPTKLVLTFSEALRSDVVPAVGQFVSSPAKTFTSVVISGATVTLIASTAFAAGATTITYTQPSTNKLQDGAANAVASFGPSAVTNNVV